MSPLINLLRALSLAFVAGVIGAGALYLARRGLAQLPFLTLPSISTPGAASDPLAQLYRVLIWGGIWGLLLAIPILNRSWWLKGALIGVLATLVARYYFRPNLTVTWNLAVYAVALNVLWGVVAAFWWSLVSARREPARRSGLLR
jgi:hypothetical protein